jgi:hypothetical protein
MLHARGAQIKQESKSIAVPASIFKHHHLSVFAVLESCSHNADATK